MNNIIRNQLNIFIVIITVSLFISSNIFSQTPNINDLNTKKETDAIIIDINNCIISNLENNNSIKLFSPGANVYFTKFIPFKSNNFGLNICIGIGSDNYNSNFYTSVNKLSITEFNIIPDSINYRINKTTLTYIDIPIELKYKSKPNNKNHSFRTSIGLKLGYLTNSRTKYFGNYYGDELGIYGEMIKYKIYNIENLNRFRYGVNARFGYGWLNLHFYYNLKPLFIKDKGPLINSYNIGISIIPF